MKGIGILVMVKVSVIIPLYNGEQYIEELILSLQKQTLKDFELIFVDDGSVDNSANIVKKYLAKDSRIKYIFQENQGAGIARNTGIANSVSDYVICIDADDLYETNMLELLYDKAIATDADIVLCKFKLWNQITGYTSGNKGINHSLIPDKEVFSYKDVKNILEITNPGPCNKLYKKEFIQKNNLKYSGTKIINDLKFGMLSLCLASKITILNEALSTYRYQISGSVSKNREKKLTTSLFVYDEIYNEFLERNLWENFKSEYFKKTIDSLKYEIAFPISNESLVAINEFFNSTPFAKLNKSELAKLFNVVAIKKHYIEYAFLFVITLGLHNTIKEKFISFQNRIKNLKWLKII